MICFLAIGLHAGFDPFDPARSQGLGRGSLGVLLAGKRQGLLAEIKSCLDSLLQHGFYIAPHLYKKFLSDAGETP